MSTSTLPATPRWASVFREQLGATGVSVRREVAVIGAILAAVTLVVLVGHYTAGVSFDFSIEAVFPAVLLGLFAPMAVWKDEEPARRSYFWAMPVDRTLHTLIKVFGGWAWFMAVIGGYVLWGLALASVTGGDTGIEEMRVLMGDLPEGVRPTVADYYTHRQVTPEWQWIVPFTGATAMYLLGSIVVLTSDHPWRWFAAAFLTYVLSVVLAEATQLDWLGRAMAAVQDGRFGLDILVTGSMDRKVTITTSAGSHVGVWLNLPAPDRWVVATLLWTGIGLAGVGIAARRYQER